MSRAVADGLRRLGFEVVTVNDVGTNGLSDIEQLGHASRLGRTLVTANARDFIPLHWRSLEGGDLHAGIVVVTRRRISEGEQIRRLTDLAAQRSAEEMRGRLEFLSDWAPGA